jgi:hypothetical protein
LSQRSVARISGNLRLWHCACLSEFAFWVRATEQRALASRRCELANCFAKVAPRRHCGCTAFGAILRPYLQGQTHRKVGAQSFRSKGCGLGQRGCRGRSAISLYSESHSRSVSSHSLTSPPKPDAARGACTRAVAATLVTRGENSQVIGGLKCKIASRSGFIHSFQFSPS